MSSMEDNSYSRYRQNRINRYRYKIEQMLAPIVMMILIALIDKFFIVVVVFAIALLLLPIVNKIEQINKRKEQNRLQEVIQENINECENKSIETNQSIAMEGEKNMEKNKKVEWTEAGTINKNNQRNNGKTNIPGTDYGQWFYSMECLNCGHNYMANGTDIWLRKCPKCQGGKE